MVREVDSPDCGWPEENCRELLLRAPWPVFIWEVATGQILEANPAACQRYGYRREELLRLRFYHLVSPPARAALNRSSCPTPSSP